MAKIISHDSHHVPVANAYDIAMVKLKRPARLDRAVNLACLPQSGGRVKNRKMCWVTGMLEEKNIKAGWGEIIVKICQRNYFRLCRKTSQRAWFLLLSFVLKLVLECCIL